MTVRIEIKPSWRFHRTHDQQSMLVMMDLLREIRTTGKVTRAAHLAGLSYRHCWNLIEKWSEFFETPLVERSRGRGTRLTEFGDKLVWADERLQARLGPQLQNLAQELETEVNQFAPSRPSTLRILASHGFAVSKLRDLLDRQPGVELDLRYVGNPASLTSLTNGSCDLAGAHLPQGWLRKSSAAALRKILNPGVYSAIGLVTRELGLMVKRGNPLDIRSLDALKDPRIRFVNREPESGSRLVLNQFLAHHQIDPGKINGYERVEFTHAAVAAYVASGMADVALGVEAAARQFDLDFIRLVTEDYFFICAKRSLELEKVQAVLDVIRGEEFRAAIAQLPGYAATEAGVIKTVQDALQ
jgi:molybdate transport repressor ModE-like protein